MTDYSPDSGSTSRNCTGQEQQIIEMIEATEVSPRVIKIMNGAARDLGERLKSRYNNSQFGLASDYESRQCHHAEP